MELTRGRCYDDVQDADNDKDDDGDDHSEHDYDDVQDADNDKDDEMVVITVNTIVMMIHFQSMQYT